MQLVVLLVGGAIKVSSKAKKGEISQESLAPFFDSDSAMEGVAAIVLELVVSVSDSPWREQQPISA